MTWDQEAEKIITIGTCPMTGSVSSHGPAVRRCKACSYINYGFDDRIPSCKEYKMMEALE